MTDDVIRLAINNEHDLDGVDARRWRAAVRSILADASIQNATISIAVVDDATMSQLHERYLDDDDTTDVLSFLLERGRGRLEGEIVVCQPVAQRAARRYGWSTCDELFLYVVHGALHLVGYDDRKPAQIRVMRDRERHYLAKFNLEIPDDTPRRRRRGSKRRPARGGKPRK